MTVTTLRKRSYLIKINTESVTLPLPEFLCTWYSCVETAVYFEFRNQRCIKNSLPGDVNLTCVQVTLLFSEPDILAMVAILYIFSCTLYHFMHASALSFMQPYCFCFSFLTLPAACTATTEYVSFGTLLFYHRVTLVILRIVNHWPMCVQCVFVLRMCYVYRCRFICVDCCYDEDLMNVGSSVEDG